MDKKIQVIVIVIAIIVFYNCFNISFRSNSTYQPPTHQILKNNFVVILAENLDKPRAIAISDNRIFVTEKDGFVRVIQDNELLESPLATFRACQCF